MTSAEPAVTIYIPTRARPALLKRAVVSALDQSYPRLEIVVALDRPTEDTRLMVRELPGLAMRADRAVRWVESATPGASAARNCALAAASGTLVTGLDDDDYLERDHLANLVRSFDADRHAFVFTGHRRIRPGKAALGVEVLVPVSTGSLALETLLRKNVVGNQVLTLTARLREAGGFDESLPAWQDYDLWLRLVKKYGPGWGLPGHSYVVDEISAPERISSSADRIDAAYRRFSEKHPEYAKPTLRAFLRMTRAAYGLGGLSLGDVARIVVSAGVSRFSFDAACTYLHGLRDTQNDTATRGSE